MSNRRIAPLSIIVFVIGAVAIVGAALLIWLRPGLNGRNSVEANDAIPFAARVDRIDGDVGIARQTSPEGQPYQGWSKTTLNAPVTLGDRIYVKDGSRAAVAFSGRNYAHLNPQTALDVVSLAQGRTQLALRQGSCVFAVGDLDSEEVFEVGTPNGAIDFAEPGLYQVGIDDEGDTVVSVLSGLANISGLAGSGEVSKGQLLTLAATEAAEAVVSALSPSAAGTIVNDYYSYRYPTIYDGRYADYSAYEEDPFYYEESYRQSISYQYVSDETEIAGLDDLDAYGDWEDVPNYGHCWRPRNTGGDWAPYRDGYWSHDYPVGLTWVSNERWGWAPYHYGRWAHVNQIWFWVPEEAVRRPVYAPALVTFVQLPQADEIGWVPLGPGDPYVPRYYDRDYRPHYIGSQTNVDFVNYRDPAAVTIVSISQFTRVITPATVMRLDPAYLAGTRPVVDPFAVSVVKELAPTMEASKPVMPIPVEVHQVLARPIVVKQQPGAPAIAANITETLKVQPIPEDKAKRKLKVKNSESPVVATQSGGLPALPPEAKVGPMNEQERQARIAALSARAAQGNKAAKRELRQMEEQQRQQTAQQALAQQQQQLEQRKAEKQAERAKAQQAEQQRQAQAAEQAEERKAQKQAARAQAQQAEQQRQTQAAQDAEQRKAQKQAARAQAQQAAQQRQAQAAQEAEQRKAQKRAARQQPQQAEQQAAQQAEQRKAQKQAARQQAEQQRQAQAAQQAQQRQAEKRAAQQAEQQRQAHAAQQLEQQRNAQKQAARQQAQQAEQQRQAQAAQQAAQQAEQRNAQKRAARQQAQQAEQQRQSQAAQQAAQQAEQRKAQKQAAQQQAQQEAARQQAQREQQRIQKQAQQQAQQQSQQQRQQQKAEKRAQRQNEGQQPQQPQAQPQVNPGKAERKAEKAKNKNKNSNP